MYSKIVIYGKIEGGLQPGVTALPPPQLQSLHHKVMIMSEPTPKLNSCIIP